MSSSKIITTEYRLKKCIELLKRYEALEAKIFAGDLVDQELLEIRKERIDCFLDSPITHTGGRWDIDVTYNPCEVIDRIREETDEAVIAEIMQIVGAEKWSYCYNDLLNMRWAWKCRLREILK